MVGAENKIKPFLIEESGSPLKVRVVKDSKVAKRYRHGWTRVTCNSNNGQFAQVGVPRAYKDVFVESVYNLRPTVSTKVVRSPRYVSKYAQDVRTEQKLTKRSMRNFGPEHLHLNSPQQYLKAAPKVQCFPPKVCPRMNIPPVNPICTWNAIPQRPLSKDFIKKTQNYVLSLKPKIPIPRTVDERNGGNQVLTDHGLVPKYVLKRGYGQVPKYIKNYEKNTFKKRQSEFNGAKEAELLESQSRYRRIKEDERKFVLEKLHQNFDEAMRQFQGISFALDNQSKVQKKRALEKTLNELEKTIDTISRLKVIVIKLGPQD